jgi:DNA/RNA endonuclease G (NUC1)
MRYQEFKEDKFNKCYDYAEQLYTRAKQKGLDAELVQVAGYQGDDTLADKRWKEIPKKYWKHYVVKMGTTVLDRS